MIDSFKLECNKPVCLTIYELSLTIIMPAKDIVAVVAFADVVKFVKNKHIS